MHRVDPGVNSVKEIFDLMSGGIGPRPIALVSTVSASGIRNLAPFSFFNVFGSNPPTVAFSPSRRLRDASLKHTYRNLAETRECVIQVVTYPMVQQVSLASTEYPDGVDEFVKSGLTPVPSERVKPWRVKESPLQMECVLRQLVALGDGPASGNLAICEVVLFHVAKDLYPEGHIDCDRMDLVARLGGDLYVRASGQALFKVPKPARRLGIGYDALPEWVRRSRVLSANDLGQLANTERLPNEPELQAFAESLAREAPCAEAFDRAERAGEPLRMLGMALEQTRAGHPDAQWWHERAARVALARGDADLAWKALLLAEAAR